MSKYDELCRNLEATRSEWKQFKTECTRLAEQLSHGFVNYLGVPPGRWRVLPANVQPSTLHLPYDMASAIQLDEQGQWIALLQIDLLAAGGELPTLQPMIFPIKISKKDIHLNEFEVCFAEKTCRTMHDGLPSEFEELFAAAYLRIAHELDQHLETFLTDNHTLTPRKIGFV